MDKLNEKLLEIYERTILEEIKIPSKAKAALKKLDDSPKMKNVFFQENENGWVIVGKLSGKYYAKDNKGGFISDSGRKEHIKKFIMDRLKTQDVKLP